MSSSTNNFLSTPLSTLTAVRSMFKKRHNTTTSLLSAQSNNNSLTSIISDFKRNNLLEFIKSDASLPVDQKPVDFISEFINQENELNQQVSQEPVGEVELVQATKSEQVFQVLKDAIDTNDNVFLDRSFIDQVITTLKYQQMKDKRHKDNVKRMCRILELLVFLLITIMTVFLIYNVFHRLKMIHEVSLRSSRTVSVFPIYIQSNSSVIPI